jgi:hypothetical protein
MIDDTVLLHHGTCPSGLTIALLLLRCFCNNAQGHEGYEDNMIDDAIEDEFNENEQSFNPVSGRCAA